MSSGLVSQEPEKKSEEKKEKKAKHLVYEGLTTLGSLLVVSGGNAKVQDNTVSTQAGFRPTVAPRGVQLIEGRW